MKKFTYTLIPISVAWNLKLGWPSCDESKDGKENRGLRSKPSYSYGCLANKWMDLKGIHYCKSNSDKFNMNISMFTVELFMLSRFYHFINPFIVIWFSKAYHVDTIGLIYLM